MSSYYRRLCLVLVAWFIYTSATLCQAGRTGDKGLKDKDNVDVASADDDLAVGTTTHSPALKDAALEAAGQLKTPLGSALEWAKQQQQQHAPSTTKYPPYVLMASAVVLLLVVLFILYICCSSSSTKPAAVTEKEESESEAEYTEPHKAGGGGHTGGHVRGQMASHGRGGYAGHGGPAGYHAPPQPPYNNQPELTYGQDAYYYGNENYNNYNNSCLNAGVFARGDVSLPGQTEHALKADWKSHDHVIDEESESGIDAHVWWKNIDKLKETPVSTLGWKGQGQVEVTGVSGGESQWETEFVETEVERFEPTLSYCPIYRLQR